MNTNIFSIAIYYWTFRLIWVLSTGRGRLINWIEQIVYWSVSISLSLWVYSLIEQVEKILPDPRSLLDQLWILIIVFLYSIFNKVQLGRKGTIKRKNNYITSRYRLFHRKYDYLINGFFHNGFYEALTYSIMIYEDFNRPRVVRWIEYIRFWITKKPHSLGIMQVQTNMIYMGGARTLNKKLKAGAVSSLMTTDICIYPTEIACNPSQFTIKNNAMDSMI